MAVVTVAAAVPTTAHKLRRLGLPTAALLVVANMIGTGVFTTTGLLIGKRPTPPAVLLGWLAGPELADLLPGVPLLLPGPVLMAWVLGGLLALCGALSYAELAAALPRNGGEYQFLSRIYHPAVGFVAGWVSLVVGFSAPIAASAIGFSEYLVQILPGTPEALLQVGSFTVTPEMGAALVLILLLSALHGVHVTLGGNVQNVFTLAKVGLILVLIVGGVMQGEFGRVFEGHGTMVTSSVAGPAFAIGLIYISFAYSGWNGAAYLAGEVRNPARTLPLALIVGTLAVVLLYVGLNAVFLAAAPLSELAGVVAVGHVAARHIFGEGAGTLLTGGIALALVSSVSAMIMAGPRVYEAMGHDYTRLGFLASRTRKGAPAAAVVLQALVATVMVLTASFDALLAYIGFTLSLSAALTVAGVLVLRRRAPGLARPYRAWGYPVTPILFLALSAWMVVHTLVERPESGLAGLGTIGVGVVLYYVLRHRGTDFSRRDTEGTSDAPID